MRKVVQFMALTAGLLSAAAQDQDIYTDSLQNSWQDWSWATVSLSATSPVHTGTKSISVTAGAWQALYFHHDAFDSSGFTNITFWIHGGPSGGQKLNLFGLLSGAQQNPVTLHPTNGWQHVTISLIALGVANKPDLDGFWISDSSGTTQSAFFIDDLKLVMGAPPPLPGPVTLMVDAAADRHPIDPRVYGMAFASQAQVADLNTPLNRSGGNSESRYNWQINAHNHAFDWYFESIADSSSTPGAETDSFIAGTKNSGAEAMVTVPVMPWTPKLGSNRAKLASFSVAKYGAQTGTDSQYMPDAGNGIKTGGAYVTGNDPNDANVPVTTEFQLDWVRHLTNRWGLTPNGGVRYYILDNEPSLWHSTHRDIHPSGETLAEIRDKYFDFAPKIKDLDPGAFIVGPEEWGWSGYFYSGADQQAGPANNWSKFPDREANGNQDYMPWFLDRMREQSAATGRRLLDVFTLHYYPQSGEYSNDTSSSMQLIRNRSTRSLWDTNYTDASWISDKVKLIPRMREWVNGHYPGTPIGITEYSWGADGHISGAIAQADVLGILGREGLDLATRWTTPATGTPTYNAIKMYRNYDGNKSTFGETSVRATAPNPDNIAIFAARRADGALTVMAINKQLTMAAPTLISLTNFASTIAQRWQLTSANAVSHLTDQPVIQGVFSNTLPAQSITLFVLPNAGSTNPPPNITTPRADSSNVHMMLNGVVGKNYAIEATADFTSWIRQQTNVATAASFDVAIPIPSGTRFFRAVQLN